MLIRLLKGRSRPLAAIVAQLCQAVGTFGIQLIAAWLLGAVGLGVLSLCLGVMVLAAALVSGMVGDSLVILDRRDRATRAGLQVWVLVLVAASFLLASATLAISGLLTLPQALLMATAMAAFQLEELVRRLLMANLAFWRLVVMDTVAVIGGLGSVLVWAAFAAVEVHVFFLAILIGQVAAMAAGLLLLPAGERVLAPLRGAAVGAVAGFGAWRGAQVSVAPLLLTGMRVVVTAVAGRAALGELELARIYVAPALLSVQGLGSYLLSSYARDRPLPLPLLVRRAWRASWSMIGGAVLVGGALVLLAPWLAHLVSGPQVTLDPLAAVGWAVYVTATASLQPFASLAAARGRPSQVLRCRVVDAGGALAALIVLLNLGLPVSGTPFILAAGLLLGGVLVRRFALQPLLDDQPRPAAGSEQVGNLNGCNR